MDVKFVLEERLGRRVDLVTHRALKPRLYERIANELVRILCQGERERKEMRTAATKLSEKSFARVWDTPDDAEYDRL